MLIKVFGIWIMASNITSLTPYGSNSCNVYFGYARHEIYAKNCEDVGQEINRQIALTNTPK